ncbi:MAG: glycosyltransferase [Bacteroidales bacterium]|jgi:glycosyltransferase involved in cell wall biosynthesis|nr:glycosyltransferase [Bacteroidales bacterium]
MHIALFVNSFNIGGIERFVITLANGLSSRHDVDIIVCKNVGILKDTLSQRINIYDLGNINVKKSIMPLLKYINKHTPQILISGGVFLNIIIVVCKIFSHTKVKYIVSQHSLFDSETKMFGPLSFIVPLMILFLYSHADAVVAVSDSVNAWLNKIGIKKSLLCRIFNPIDINEKTKHSFVEENIYEEYLLYVGRLVSIKNILLIFKAFKIVLSERRNLKLLIAGSGQEECFLKTKCQEIGIYESCIFLGNIAYPEPLIKNARAVLIASFSEAMPFIVLESFALNTYIVSTPAQGCLDIFKLIAYDYYTKSFTDAVEYSELIFKILSMQSPCDLSEKIEEIFGVKNIINQYEALFVKIAGMNKIAENT